MNCECHCLGLHKCISEITLPMRCELATPQCRPNLKNLNTLLKLPVSLWYMKRPRWKMKILKIKHFSSLKNPLLFLTDPKNDLFRGRWPAGNLPGQREKISSSCRSLYGNWNQCFASVSNSVGSATILASWIRTRIHINMQIHGSGFMGKISTNNFLGPNGF